MKLSCIKENLQESINIVGRIVSPRGTLPVLNNILLQTDLGRVKLSATDLEIGINTWVGAKIDKEGSITIPARLITDFINTNDDKKINLSLENTTLTLESEKHKAHIKGIEASEFPLIPEVKKGLSIEINAQDLKKSIAEISFAAAIDETRPVLTGILIKIKGKEMKMVATDSYRLAEKTINLGSSQEKNIDLIIPHRTMNELARIIPASEEKIELRIGENQILFNFTNTQLVSRLIEGNFPDYEQIIPRKSQTKAIINKNNFANAIKMASLFARESANNIRLKIDPKGKVEIIAVSQQVGDNISHIEAKATGETVEIAFNSKFILDVLAVIQDEEVILETSDKLSPGMIKPSKDKNYIYIIMPLRVEE